MRMTDRFRARGLVLVSVLSIACTVSALGIGVLSSIATQQTVLKRYYLKLKLINWLNQQQKQMIATFDPDSLAAQSGLSGDISYSHHISTVLETSDTTIFVLTSQAQTDEVKAKLTQTLLYSPVLRNFKLGSYQLN